MIPSIMKNMIYVYTLDKNMEYLESTMETLVFDILISWKRLCTNHKHVFSL